VKQLVYLDDIDKNDRLGRPRDPAKDDLVRTAVRKLLVEHGYQAATIPAVAREAGVGAPTVYRRWATQSQLVQSALAGKAPLSKYENATNFLAYLEIFVHSVVDYFADPAVAAAAPGLLVEYSEDLNRYALLVQRAEDPIRDHFRAAHRDAVLEGVVAAVPGADALFDTIIGMAIYHGVWRRSANDQLAHDIITVVRAAALPA
jgi:AcrR family transcriptional regulator